jgi:hypothetical protein
MVRYKEMCFSNGEILLRVSSSIDNVNNQVSAKWAGVAAFNFNLKWNSANSIKRILIEELSMQYFSNPDWYAVGISGETVEAKTYEVPESIQPSIT